MDAPTETTAPMAEVGGEQEGLIEAIAALKDRAEAAENNELQAYRLLLPRLVGDLNEARAQNEDLQRMIRESKPPPEKAGGEP